jgi:hypothetical protein
MIILNWGKLSIEHENKENSALQMEKSGNTDNGD